MIPIDSPTWQGWYDPDGPYWEHPDHQQYFKYNIDYIPDPFYQEEGTIYWLEICPFVDWLWGWKSSEDHWADDAVSRGEYSNWEWDDLYEPPDFQQSLDLAFVITTPRVLEPKWSQLPHGPEEGFDEASDFWWNEGPLSAAKTASGGRQAARVAGAGSGDLVDTARSVPPMKEGAPIGELTRMAMTPTIEGVQAAVEDAEVSARTMPADPIMWDNYPSGHGGWVVSSQLDPVYPMHSQAADDFRFLEDTLVTDVHWTGRYWNQDPPLIPNTTNFHILFYADDGTGNAPTGAGPGDPSGTALAHYNIPIGAITVTPNGAITDGYDYEVYLPPITGYPDGFIASGGAKYWIAIQSENIFPPQWGIMDSLDQKLHNAMFGFPLLGDDYWADVETDPGVHPDMCFRLTGEPLSGLNKVVADDFQSDGQPIEAVRWWGSYLDDHYAPDFGPVEPHILDGWFISFHHDEVENPGCPPGLDLGDPHPTVLGIYYCPSEAVEWNPMAYLDCLDHPVYEYTADLNRCCLLCSEEDPRSAGYYPAQPEAFLEECGLWYWLDIQAVVGVTWQPPLCNYEDRILTGHLPSDITADGHFWGWHTSPWANRNEACTGKIYGMAVYPPNCWDYGAWDATIWSCPPPVEPVNMAFELLAPPPPPCPPADPPAQPAGEAGYTKMRNISMEPGNPGRLTALRVTLTNLPEYSEFNDTKCWVGPPSTYCENAGVVTPPCPPTIPATDYVSARLQGTPHCMDWSTVGALHVTDDEIVPPAVYDVQAIDCSCNFCIEANYSAPLTIVTSRYGDLVGTCAVTPCSPPDGTVGIPSDVTACLDKFKNLPNAVLKSRADLDWAVPNRRIDISDVTFVLDAFRGCTYSRTPPFPFCYIWRAPDGCP